MTRKHPDRLHVISEQTDPEFAVGVDLPPNELDRRELMKLLAAGAALAGVGPLAGCMERPKERIVPRVIQPPELTPGVPVAYATTMTLDGYATGLVVQTLEARPIKVEGNPDHPASLGASTAFHQASILELYDPHRATGGLHAGAPMGLDRFIRDTARRTRIPGLWFLLHPHSSPLVIDMIERVRARHPGARFAFYSPVDRRAVHEGTRIAFGRALDPQYRFDQADVVVSLDADFTAAMPNSLRWARDFAERRRLRWPIGNMSRLYVAEPRPSPTGTLADHRLPAKTSGIGRIATAILGAITNDAMPGAGALTVRERLWVNGVAADLAAARGRSIVVAGDRQPAAVHALVHLINAAIGSHGATIAFTDPAVISPLGDDLATLAGAIAAGEVQTLVIVEANPVYTAPDLALPLQAIPETIYAGLERNETAAHCRSFVPLAHYMESWGDARSYDGTISLVQPLIRPLHPSVSLPELLATFAGDPRPDGHRLLRERYVRDAGDAALLSWQRLLQLGFVPATAFPAMPVSVQANARDIVQQLERNDASGIEISFDVSHAVHDGRFAGVSWLQELPKPHDKITWGNAAVMSPATARQLGVKTEDVVRIARGAAAAELPVYVLPGHADACVSVELGYGRWAAGPIGDGVGSNVYPLRTTGAPPFAVAEIRKTGKRLALASTQKHFDQQGRSIALAAELADYREHPDFTEAHRGPVPTLLPQHFADTPAWGMTIDTMICTGCSSCVVACQAENNVPIVGRAGVLNNREMHWLRIDTYREQRGDDVEVIHQPMLCQHCENAPCEYVCPVYATQHSPDGLNEMIYNRCIGTRFCSNNCPYKVRRFNWFDYTEDTPKKLRLQYNPNVTVRARGVMEKCTYCVQRIRGAEIEARKAQRDIRPNEVVTACQQACPTGAIKFGRLDHERTDVVEWRNQPRRYAVLHHLGTQPRTIYLAKIRNPR